MFGCIYSLEMKEDVGILHHARLLSYRYFLSALLYSLKNLSDIINTTMMVKQKVKPRYRSHMARA